MKYKYQVRTVVARFTAGIEDQVTLNQDIPAKAIVKIDRSPQDVEHDIVRDGRLRGLRLEVERRLPSQRRQSHGRTLSAMCVNRG